MNSDRIKIIFLMNNYIMKVLAWNILADEFVAGEYYPMVTDRELEREKRLLSILSKVKEYNADVMLLQEVMIMEKKHLEKFFGDNYYISPINRMKWLGWEMANPESGNLMMLDKSKFNKIKYEQINEFGYITCEHKNKKMFVTSVHLDDKSASKRLAQIKKVVEICDKYDRVIIGGDFNDKLDKKPKIYQHLIKHGYKMAVNEVTYYIESNFAGDNIFFRKFRMTDSMVDNTCGSRSIQNIKCQFDVYGSDHFPVLAKLKI